MTYSQLTRRGWILGLFIILFSLAPAVFAQSNGRLIGTVTDTQGGLVPNAQVTVKGLQAEGQFTAVANKEGGWTLPSIPAGTYIVTVTAPGFKSTVVQDVKVDVGQPSTVNVTLEVGQ